MLHGVIIDNIDTFEAFGLVLLADVEIGSPTPKISRINIPGRNGTLRMKETFHGTPVYGDRKIQFSLFRSCADPELMSAWREFAAMVHGQEVQLILPGEPNFYYFGTLELGNVSGYNSGVIPVTMTAEPYKYSIVDSTEEWWWDTFCFSTDVARTYSELAVNGEVSYRIIGSGMPVVPVFIVNSQSGDGIAMSVMGKSYQLSDGESVLGIVLNSSDYTFTFSGNGTVSIKFREGVL